MWWLLFFFSWKTYLDLSSPYLTGVVEAIIVVSFISDRIQQWYRNRKTFCKYQYSHDIETLLHSAGGHQGSRKAHQADNQKNMQEIKGRVWGSITSWNFRETLTLTVIYCDIATHNKVLIVECTNIALSIYRGHISLKIARKGTP